MVDELMAFYREDVSKGDYESSQSAIKLIKDNIKAIIMVMNHLSMKFFSLFVL